MVLVVLGCIVEGQWKCRCECGCGYQLEWAWRRVMMVTGEGVDDDDDDGIKGNAKMGDGVLGSEG